MKDDKKWLGAGIALFAVSITRYILNSIGGIKSLPYWAQIFISLMIPILPLLAFKKEKKKLNNFDYKLIKSVIIFFIIMTILLINVIVLSNSFPMYWGKSRKAFAVITVTLFTLFGLYVAVLILNDNRKRK